MSLKPTDKNNVTVGTTYSAKTWEQHAIHAIESGIDYARECLITHNSNLGRTTLKHRTRAERMEEDIQHMEGTLTALRLCPNATDGGCPLATSSESLANDLARCDGVGFQEDDGWDWREGCETCLRRTAQRHDQVSMMEPPAIIAFECEFIIPPNSSVSHEAPKF